MLEKYTKVAPLTKSLTLELKPVGNTRETIKSLGHLETDDLYMKQAAAVEPIVDEFIKGLANKVLMEFDGSGLFDSLAEILAAEKQETKGKKKKNASARNKAEEAIKKAILKATNAAYPGFTTKKMVSEKFISETLADYVSEDSTRLLTLKNVKGKTALLSKFMVSRTTALETSMPERVIENFYIYMDNAEKMKRIKESPVMADIEANYPDAGEITETVAYEFRFLTQKGIDEYNLMISGKVSEDGIVNKGINMITNEYNTFIRGRKDTKSLPKLKKLKKQILMPAEKAFHIEQMGSDEDVRTIITQMNENFLPAAETVIEALRSALPEDVYIYGNKLHIVSHLIYADHHKVGNTLCSLLEAELTEKLTETTKKSEIRKINEQIEKVSDAINNKDRFYSFKELGDVMNDDLYKVYTAKASSLVTNLKTMGEECERLISPKTPIRGDGENTQTVRDYFHAWTKVRDILGTINRRNEEDINTDFYDVFSEQWEDIRITYKGENLVRNYLTKEMGKTLATHPAFFGAASRVKAKWKVPDEKFSIGTNTFIRHDGRFYFFCLPYGSKPVYLEGSDEGYMILQMRNMQDPMKRLPCLVFGPASEFFEENPDADEFVISENVTSPITVTREMYDVYRSGDFKTAAAKEKGEDIFREALMMIMTIYKEYSEKYTIWSDRTFPFKDLHEYNNLAEFYEDMGKVSSVQKWIPGNKEVIEKLVKDGKGLMFEITNRFIQMYDRTGDWNKLNSYAKTFMFLVSDENQKDMCMKLNSRPQLAYREAAKGKPKKHTAGSILVNRRDIDGNFIPTDIHSELYRYYNDMVDSFGLSNEAKEYIREKKVCYRKAEYDITRDRRFYREQFKLTLSYEKNTNCSDSGTTLNKRVAEDALSANRVIIIRNMQDILFMMVTGPDGEVIEKRSLNVIDGIDYHKRLNELEREKRSKASTEWDHTGKVKNLRKGYLSKAISEIAHTVVKYDAILILEKVSDDSKDKYFALGNTAFKSFEDMLCNRLADLCFKGVPEGKPGSISNPYQLCYQKNLSEWQNGIVFFVPAYGTANLDAETGFRCDFKTNMIQTKRAKTAFLSKFDLIRYNKERQGLEIRFNYDNFNTIGNPDIKEWHMLLTEGVVVFDRENKCNRYVEHPFADLPNLLKKLGFEEDVEIQKLALDDKLTGKIADLVFSNVMKLLRGYRGAHDGKRAAYISPVTGRKTDISENAAQNLGQKFKLIKTAQND